MTDQQQAPSEIPEEKSGRPHPAWFLVVVAVLALYAVGIATVGGEDALEALRSAAVLPLVGAFLMQVAVMLIWPLVHRASLRAVGADLGYLEALQVSMTAFTVSHVIPGGGAVGAAAAVERLHRFGIRGPTAAASAALTGPLSLTTIAGLGALGITIAVVTGQLPQAALIAALVALVVLFALIVGIVAALRSPTFGERVIDAVGRLHRRLRAPADKWRDTWHTVSEQAPAGRQLVPIVAWSTVKWSADVASLALIFLAFGRTPQLMTLLVGFGVAQILTAIPSTPGAVGIFESGMAGAFALFGIPLGVATTLTITYRVFETWLPTLAGIPVVLRPR